MKFCPKCGSVLLTNKEGKLYCPNCKTELKRAKKRISITMHHSPKETTIVVGEKESQIKTMPTIKVVCPRCGNDEAYWWFAQTRSIDESTTQFFRCTKCGYTWREYS